MEHDPQLTLKKNHIEAWGLWWIQWQQHTKARLRRHTVSTQTRMKIFEEKHLKSGPEHLLSDAAVGSVLLPK